MVNHDNRFDQRGEDGTDAGCGDILRIAINIGKDWASANRDHAARRCQKRPARRNNLVPCADSKRAKRQFQGNGPIGDGHCEVAFGKSRELFLEPASFRSRPVVHLSGAQDCGRRFDLVFSEIRP